MNNKMRFPSNSIFSCLFILATACVLTGCAHQDKSIYYSKKCICTDSVFPISVNTLNDSSLWRFPLQMECTDSLIIILDYVNEHYFHLYTQDGKPVGQFARKGQGPGELLSANQFHLSAQKDTLYVYDSTSRKIVAYQLPYLQKDTIHTLPYQEYNVNYSLLPPSETPHIIYDMLPIRKDLFLVKGNQPSLRYGIYDFMHHTLTPKYTDFPDRFISSNKEEAWSVLSSDTRTFFKPDCTKMLNATYIGGILEIFSCTADIRLSNDTTLLIYEPEYGVAEGAVPVYVVGNEHTQLGFEDIHATNRYIYALLHDINDAMEPKDITLLNWAGKPIRKIKTHKRLSRLCVNEQQNVIYAMALHKENGYELLSIHLRE